MQTSPDIHPSLIELARADVVSSVDGAMTQVEAVNWQVRPGEYWVIGGANASGKSDLLATAACLQRPGGGSVRIFGRDVSALREPELLRQRLRIGIVFRTGRLFAHLRVAENIALPLRYRFNWTPAQADEEVDALLQLAGLSDCAHVAAGLLSPHLQQRAGLARALALKPEVLFLDDPLAGLEPRHRRWWLDFLGQLSRGIPRTQGRPLTLAVATNDLEPWLDQGRQFAFIKEKRWLALRGAVEAKNLIANEHQ